ncbi:diphthamide biosynthesis protein [Coniophora puteana RWD-64-598 SS2]|uniref:2-(3-amino-3-carboxypropyl)histidine synthase subunit 2 n=1 Tax=Coniophora puteana (strain RWD-64-598) TaxID=741705 RepID=A0A5M3MFG1_CONPW|nr:diphthamide biosynthesis protein [Coniophora puteana RWD-64-598 SS2]EIW77988.1 diphthamide biosynthesis protein [Coniophora puteana RWD-64-598 SS2]
MSSDPITSAFSPSGAEVIARSLEVDIDHTADQLSADEFSTFYEIERTAQAILNGGFSQIALQFPDELLHDSVPIFRLLKQRVGPGRDLYVLADTSYGSCCVDEVAAQHVDADLMVHYGHACMSQTYRLPVIYVFGKKLIDVDQCVNKFAALVRALPPPEESEGKNRVALRYDVAYHHRAGEILDKLRESTQDLPVEITCHLLPTRLDPPVANPAPPTDAADSSPENSTEAPPSTILYIGPESLGLTNLLMTHSSSQVYSYDPSSSASSTRLESPKSNRLLMRRFAAVQKARDADVFGILVGTLGVASYLPLIAHLRAQLARARKKSYTISVGKLNPAKLANFMEVECFVLVACPENSVVESKEFFKPIVTPFELEVALMPEGTWTGRYVLDFEQLLAESKALGTDEERDVNGDEDEEDRDRPSFSLVTGKYRSARQFRGISASNMDPSAIVLRNQNGTVATLADSAAALYLQSRTYQGLEARVGEDAPSVLEQGRSGIARGYGDDRRLGSKDVEVGK